MPASEVLDIVTIEGGIGAGKSSVLDALKAARPSLCYLDEPVKVWERYGLLARMYDGSIPPATFQLAALATRMAPLLKVVADGERLVVSERCPYSDKAVFTQATLDKEVDLAAYGMAYNALTSVLPKKVNLHVIYLKADVDVLFARMQERGRAAERIETPDHAKTRLAYLEKLHTLHDAFFSMTAEQLGVSTVSQHIVDATLPAAEVAKAVEEALRKVAPVKLERLDGKEGAA